MQTVFERRGVISTVFERRGVISSAFERYERPMDQLWFSVETARLEARANEVVFSKEQPLQLVVDPALLQITASEVAFEKESPLELAVDTARLDVTASEVEFSIVEADQEFHVDGALLELTANEVVFSKEQPLEFAVDTARVEATAAEVTFDREEPLSFSVDTARLEVTASEVSFDTSEGQTLEVDTAQLAVTASEVTFDKEEPLELSVDTARLEVTASEVEFEPEGGSNPYYDAAADFYYELSDANDSNGGAHLTLANTPSFANDGVFGKCMTLNGTSQYAYDASGAVASAVAANGHSVRIRMLINWDTKDVNSCPIAFGSTNFGVLIRNTGNFEMRWGTNTSRVSVAGFWSGITTGQWYELVFEWGWLYENNAYKGCRAYIDSNLIGQSSINLYDGATIGNLHIGQFGGSPNWYLDGKIDEVSITTPCVPPV